MANQQSAGARPARLDHSWYLTAIEPSPPNWTTALTAASTHISPRCPPAGKSEHPAEHPPSARTNQAADYITDSAMRRTSASGTYCSVSSVASTARSRRTIERNWEIDSCTGSSNLYTASSG